MGTAGTGLATRNMHLSKCERTADPPHIRTPSRCPVSISAAFGTSFNKTRKPTRHSLIFRARWLLFPVRHRLALFKHGSDFQRRSHCRRDGSSTCRLTWHSRGPVVLQTPGTSSKQLLQSMQQLWLLGKRRHAYRAHPVQSDGSQQSHMDVL